MPRKVGNIIHSAVILHIAGNIYNIGIEMRQD